VTVAAGPASQVTRHWPAQGRRTSLSWSARRSFTCIADEISPISSRKSVPPFAASKNPGRSRSAPVKAPRAWPKSSLSSSVSVTAPQLTATNGRAALGDSSWTSRAIRSLPTPLSPVMSTVDSTLATRWSGCGLRRGSPRDPTTIRSPSWSSTTPTAPRPAPGTCVRRPPSAWSPQRLRACSCHSCECSFFVALRRLRCCSSAAPRRSRRASHKFRYSASHSSSSQKGSGLRE
jgi:hypothetical protein